MNNIISIKIDRVEDKYILVIEHLDENSFSIFSEYSFDDVYSSFDFLSTIKN